MSTQTILIIILIGLAAGLFSGIVGVGGGIILVPALIFFVGLTQHQAQGTTLGLLIFPVGLLGVLNYYKKDPINFRIVALLAIGFVVGSYFGSKVAVQLDQAVLRRIFAIVMLVIAVRMLFFEK